MRSHVGRLGILGCTAFVWSVLPLQASSRQVVDSHDMLPDETVLIANYPGIPDVVLRHEVLLAEADADLMPRPIYVAVAEDGRQYHVDGELELVRVFDAHGRHLFDVGANGPEGTRVVDPWIVAILDNRLYVYERRFPKLKVYTLEGEYVEAITVPVSFCRPFGAPCTSSLEGFEQKVLLAGLSKAEVARVDYLYGGIAIPLGSTSEYVLPEGVSLSAWVAATRLGCSSQGALAVVEDNDRAVTRKPSSK